MQHRRYAAIIMVMISGVLASLAQPGLSTSATTKQIAPSQAARTTVIASGLDNPRGLTFGQDGALYVAEAGRGGAGPCITGTEGEVCYGPSGAITRVITDTPQRLISGLPSLANAQGNSATGPHDISLLPDGSGYAVIGLGNDPAVRSQLGAAGPNFGQLVAISETGQFENLTDIAAYEQASNPDGQAVDTNPYAVLALDSWLLVVDAGANALLEVDRDGRIVRATTFPTRTVAAPPGIPGLPPQLAMESVPNSVAIGPDGAYYVGELTGFPFPVGGARVYRVVPGQQPEVYASGFTNIIDIAFDGQGNLYVLEIAANSILAAGQGGFQGALLKVTPELTQTTVISAGLNAPAGLSLGPQGGIYLSNGGVLSGTGQILRVDQCDPNDTTCQEPVPPPAPFSLVASGENEVDEEGTPGQGDPDGQGRAIITLDADAGQACVQATVSNIEQPTLAHIHQGAAGTNGPPVVNFTPLITGTLISGCVAAEASVIQSILNNPSAFYFNVHNATFPAGAVRAQLAASRPALTERLYLPLVRR